jgi:hypothetical protein
MHRNDLRSILEVPLSEVGIIECYIRICVPQLGKVSKPSKKIWLMDNDPHAAPPLSQLAPDHVADYVEKRT